MNLPKPAYSLYVTLYHRDELIHSIQFSGDVTSLEIINARPHVYYTENIKANYTDGSSATASIVVNTY